MSHPFQSVRQSKVEHSRVGKLTAGYAGGGHADAPADRKMIKGMVKSSALKMEGKASGGRLDKYARGGAVKKGATNVNVIIAPQGGGGAAPPPMIPPIAAGAPPPPPMGGPPGMMPPGGPPGGPAMLHRSGGRAYAKGGSVKEQSIRAGTPVMNSPGKNDGKDIFRPKQITYATGGPVEAMRMGPKLPGGDNGIGRLAKASLQKRSKTP